jgi:hypothetical protein
MLTAFLAAADIRERLRPALADFCCLSAAQRFFCASAILRRPSADSLPRLLPRRAGGRGFLP